jgi:beta-glucanase (GH16 family)
MVHLIHKWTYDLGTGDGGWGNGEAQTYTNSSDNVIVAGGNLKSLLKVGGYTSSRLKSEGKYKFTYGKVEVELN